MIQFLMMYIETILNPIILGAVEGITEFLPISSTAHLILTSRLLGLEQTEFQKSFDIIVQVGAILAIVILYWQRLLRDWQTLKRVVVAFVPTGILGLAFYKLIKMYLLGSINVVLISLFLGGLFLVVFEWWRAKRGDKPKTSDINKLSYKQCLAIGVFQSIAMIPGVSRAAATIVGGLLLGLNRKTIVEFSFLLAVPTMLAAAGLDLIKNASSFQADQFGFLAIGFIMSFLTALLAVKWLLSYVSKNDFKLFGWYRMGLVVVFLVLMIWL